MKVQIRPRGPSSTKIKFALGIPGPETEWRVNEATSRFQYRPKGSGLAWVDAPGSDFEGFLGSLTSDQMTVALEGTGAVSRSLADWIKDSINVKGFGAVANGTPTGGTDNTLAFQRAINFALLTGRPVKIPAGGYYFAQGSAKLDPGVGVSFVGEPGAVLYWHEGTNATPKQLFYSDSINTAKKTVTFTDIAFNGTFANRAGNQGGPPVFLDHYEAVEFHRCSWRDCTFMATDIHFTKRVVFDQCSMINICRDGARGRDVFYMSVTDCYFDKFGDNPVAWHSANYTGGDYNPNDGTPRRDGLFVSGCTFVDCVGPVAALGARVAHIINNQFYRAYNTGVFIVNSTFFQEGLTPMFNIKVNENTFMDCFQCSTPIQIAQASQRGTALSGGVIPTMPAVTTGAFVYPYPWRDANVLAALDPIPPMTDIEVCRNTISRTLKSGGAYSAWGYGKPIRSGAFIDPTVTEADLRPTTGISIRAGLNVKIEDNSISSVVDAIGITTATVNPAALNLSVRRNTVFDATNTAVRVFATGALRVDGVIADNDFNCDYYRKAAASSANGTYTNGFGFPRGIDLGTAIGMTVRNNRIANVAAAINPALPTANVYVDNELVCQPAALGVDAGNRGIADVRACGEGFRYTIVDSDPTSATFGQHISTQYDAASAMPSAGFWVRGAYVKNRASLTVSGTAGSQYVVRGWFRITTGSAHVSGVDWAIDRVPTGT